MMRICGYLTLALTIGCALTPSAGQMEDNDEALAVPLSPGVVERPITPLSEGAALPAELRVLCEWPTAEYIGTHLFARERCREILGTDEHIGGWYREYPDYHIPNVWEVATDWLRWTLAAPWTPPGKRGHQESVVLLQHDDPPLGMVLYAAESEDGRVAVVQRLYGMCVMFQPAERLRDGIAPEDFARRFMPALLNRSDELLALDDATPLNLPEGWYGKVRDTSEAKDWVEWAAWYTDGKALAVFLLKRVPEDDHIATPEDPWF